MHFLVVVFLLPISFFPLISFLPSRPCHWTVKIRDTAAVNQLAPPTTPHDPSVIRLHCNYQRTTSVSSDVLPQDLGNSSKSGFCPQVWISCSVKCFLKLLFFWVLFVNITVVYWIVSECVLIFILSMTVHCSNNLEGTGYIQKYDFKWKSTSLFC